MSEQPVSIETILPPNPILQLATECGVLTSDKSNELLSQMEPRMEPEKKIATLTALQAELEQLDTPIPRETDLEKIRCRMVGKALLTAHAHYISDGTWPEVEDELFNAYGLAYQSSGPDESSDTDQFSDAELARFQEFKELMQKIEKLNGELKKRQYRV